ncbi:zinc-binding dehydrogenase [Spiractinospora alimapuensis]|nr:zinc-binding dehydrogenase [Spiractinospora alimapuensis]QVQ52264.1 zinc-binding dehydrogenase [Spiractinospora alimapuensis]
MPTSQLAVIPAGVDVEGAATLPIAGVSALRALRALGPVLGRRLLVTGATGAVGAFAVQLAAAAGVSEVIATARNPAAFPRLRELGASTVVDSLTAELGPVHGVVDNVGGPTLAQAFRLTAANATVVSVGRASGEDTVLASEDLMGDWGRSGRAIRTFFLPEEGAELGDDIGFLLRLANEGRLHPRVNHREDLPGELTLLRGGEWPGKLVLRLHTP